MQVRGAVAVVTGAGSGIGRATAVELARRGADVAVTDVVEERLRSVVSEIESLGQRASSHAFDVADREAWQALHDAVVADRGRVSIVVNNAGVALTGPFMECDPADLDWQLQVNLYGVMHGCHVMLPTLLDQPEAHIVNVSSLFGLISVPDNAAYCMSKHAVKALSECLMVELPRHVRVTSVHPGAVATRITRDGRYRPGAGMSERATHKVIDNGVAPEQAARLIVDSIEQGSERLLIGRDAKLMAAIRWMMPERNRSLIRRWRERRMRRQRRG